MSSQPCLNWEGEQGRMHNRAPPRRLLVLGLSGFHLWNEAGSDMRARSHNEVDVIGQTVP